MKSNLIWALAAGALLCVGLAVGHYLLGSSSVKDQFASEAYTAEEVVNRAVVDRPDNESISRIARELYSSRSSDLESLVERTWKMQGLESVRRVSYRVLLSRPNPRVDNSVEFYDGTGRLQLTATTRDEAGPVFSAYSPPGDARGPAVYANYGRAQDLRLLELQGLSLRGKVLLVRLGQIPAATKARLAETRGAAALVLFPDPARVAPPRGDQEPWPSSRWLPDSAARRDTLLEEPGDPLSPGVPSSSPVAKLPLRNASLPAILCQPVGYRDALIMLGQLEGNRCPDAWVPSSGRCRLGDGTARNSIRVVVQNELMSGNVTNVLATIRGHIEPDRYVVLGSPRDGWGPGAHAPGSGTVQLLEASRVLSELHRSGTWSPRRSIVFASWGGHRYGSIGATEWVEEQVNELQSGAVAYINCHQCTDGGTAFQPSASPSLSGSLKQVASLIQVNGKTLLDAWTNGTLDEPPRPRLLSGEKDYAPFAFFAGIPAIDIAFSTPGDDAQGPAGNHPAYGTTYDRLDFVEQFLDPGLKSQKLCAQLTGSLAQLWADAALLPYDLPQLARDMRMALAQLDRRHQAQLRTLRLSLAPLEKALEEFAEATRNWTHAAEGSASHNSYAQRRMNDRMMLLERLFIGSSELDDGQSIPRPLAFGPPRGDPYRGTGFPGLEDLLQAAEDSGPGASQLYRNPLLRHLDQLALVVGRAARFLREPPDLWEP